MNSAAVGVGQFWVQFQCRCKKKSPIKSSATGAYFPTLGYSNFFVSRLSWWVSANWSMKRWRSMPSLWAGEEPSRQLWPLKPSAVKLKTRTSERFGLKCKCAKKFKTWRLRLCDDKVEGLHHGVDEELFARLFHHCLCSRL